jgi:hypothetical protein
MSIVKITNLPPITTIAANTSNTLFLGVDLATLTTGKFTATTLAAGLYSNNIINVGGNPVLYSNVIGQFSGNSNTYLQINLQNFNGNGSGDFVVSTNDSDNSTKYIDMGISGNTYNDPVNYGAFKAYDGYLYTYGSTASSATGNLILGTASANANIIMLVGGTQSNNIMGWFTKNSFTLNTQSYITFADGTRQTTAGATNAYSIAAFTVANSAAANTIITQGVDSTQNTNIQSAWTQANSANVLAQSAFNKANNALANTTGTFAGDLTITGNVTITGTVSPVKGFIYTPNIYPNAQTAITINFVNDSVVRAQTSAGLVVTLSNLLAGKEVVAWITNTTGNGQTFTHGLSALNSTINSTTYSIPATSTILARYMCIDGTTQNTFVAITHA